MSISDDRENQRHELTSTEARVIDETFVFQTFEFDTC